MTAVFASAEPRARQASSQSVAVQLAAHWKISRHVSGATVVEVPPSVGAVAVVIEHPVTAPRTRRAEKVAKMPHDAPRDPAEHGEPVPPLRGKGDELEANVVGVAAAARLRVDDGLIGNLGLDRVELRGHARVTTRPGPQHLVDRRADSLSSSRTERGGANRLHPRRRPLRRSGRDDRRPLPNDFEFFGDDDRAERERDEQHETNERLALHGVPPEPSNRRVQAEADSAGHSERVALMSDAMRGTAQLRWCGATINPTGSAFRADGAGAPRHAAAEEPEGEADQPAQHRDQKGPRR